MEGESCPLITHERTRDVNAYAERVAEVMRHSAILCSYFRLLLSVNSVIHGLIILTCAEVGDSKAAPLLVLYCAS